MEVDVSSKWLRLEEAAKMLGTGPEGVLTMIRFRELPVALHSAQVLVWREAVEAKAQSSGKADERVAAEIAAPAKAKKAGRPKANAEARRAAP